MVNTRNTDTRLEGLEKVTGDLEKQLSAIDAKLGTFMLEVRATLAEGFANRSTDPVTNNDPQTTEAASGSSPPLTIPTFDGTDAIAWLARAEQYFLVSNIPLEKRLGVAMVALAGPALPWYQLLRRRLPALTWDRFQQELMKRFGDKMALDSYEAFASTRHDGSLVEFVAAFEARLAQIGDLSDHQYLGFFLAALRPEVRMHMKAANITSYSDAVQMALQLDQLAGTQPTGAATVGPAPQMHQSSQRPTSYTPTSLSATGSNRPPSRRFRNMSSEEYRKHIAAGTCFRCGLKFGPAHRCPPKTLNVFIIDNDEPLTDSSEDDTLNMEDVGLELKLSELSFNGLDTSHTMKLFGNIDQEKVLIMVDSGASHCFISDQLATRLQLPITPTASYAVTLGDGSRVRTSGICHAVPLQLASELFSISCYVFPLRNIDIILGVTWLASLGDVTANWQRSSMIFSVQDRLVTIEGDPTLTRKACSSHDINTLDDGDSCWVLHSMMGGDTPTEFGFDPSLPPAARSQLHALVEGFPSVIQQPTTLPPARHTDHRITLKPSSQPPSTSPYSSPVLLVRKKDGSWRFCVDYRELNKRTVPDKYPIPVIQELLDELHGSIWFSKLDLKAGYHQIRVAAPDVHKTAFRTHSGHYEFLVMPFGLTNAPATFQSLMNDIFRPSLRKFVLVFFDDILVYSASWDAHLEHLRQVFRALEAHSLVVNPKKCLLARRQVEYLGHVVSSAGVSMDPSKVSAVLRWPTPTSLKTVRGFLGLTGYYRRFIRDYGKIAAPLTQLLKKPADDSKKQRWAWPAEAEQAFTALKEALTSAPLLRMPDFSREFVIECDASGRGLGLSSCKIGSLWPILAKPCPPGG
ncbi:uncharacterized protein LOC121790506 [Salvia splendens]|uniref:uncharacterized protein LOC121790506 n=1 Tax=Salvia splendens TaxID=180675 RepID=UPI001C267A28|nr:uncharacterized protein LOC121790506 [Salvia splendens]